MIIDLLQTLSQKIDAIQQYNISLNNQKEKEPVKTTISNSKTIKNVNTMIFELVSTQETKINKIEKQIEIVTSIQNVKSLSGEQGEKILEKLENYITPTSNEGKEILEKLKNFQPLTSQQGNEILERLSKLELASLLFFKSQN